MNWKCSFTLLHCHCKLLQAPTLFGHFWDNISEMTDPRDVWNIYTQQL
jgi:hypothetical protein